MADFRTDAAVTANEIMLYYTSKEINRNFKIKVSGTINGTKINTLVGVKGFLNYVGDYDLANRLLDKAFYSMEDKKICKLRRGIQIAFYCY